MTAFVFQLHEMKFQENMVPVPDALAQRVDTSLQRLINACPNNPSTELPAVERLQYVGVRSLGQQLHQLCDYAQRAWSPVRYFDVRDLWQPTNVVERKVFGNAISL